MAESSSLTERLKELTECCICTEAFKDPRMLPCIHTFCLDCLEKTGKEIQPGEKMPCPLCRTQFQIPDQGFRGMQKNFFMESLLNVHRLSTPLPMEIYCDACAENQIEEVPSAKMFCFECDQKLCDLCCQWHKRTKATKQHELIGLKDKEALLRTSMNTAKRSCQYHTSK